MVVYVWRIFIIYLNMYIQTFEIWVMYLHSADAVKALKTYTSLRRASFSFRSETSVFYQCVGAERGTCFEQTEKLVVPLQGSTTHWVYEH
jgi:hypothetical protein